MQRINDERYDMDYIRNIAKICHQTNKAYCEMVGDTSQVEWEEAPLEIRKSAINGVIFHLDHETTPEDSHKNWMLQKEKDGWVYGIEKDIEKKTHPCMVEYDKLPSEQRRKDYLFKAIVDTFKVEIIDKKREI